MNISESPPVGMCHPGALTQWPACSVATPHPEDVCWEGHCLSFLSCASHPVTRSRTSALWSLPLAPTSRRDKSLESDSSSLSAGAEVGRVKTEHGPADEDTGHVAVEAIWSLSSGESRTTPTSPDQGCPQQSDCRPLF